MEQFELPRLYQPITGAKIVYAPTQGEDHFKFRRRKANGKKDPLFVLIPALLHPLRFFDPHPRSVPLAAVFLTLAYVVKRWQVGDFIQDQGAPSGWGGGTWLWSCCILVCDDSGSFRPTLRS